MAYDATGKWTPENDQVDAEVTRITSQNTPIMKQAATTGLKMANRRGLMNSSMAVGAAQNEVIKTALPMASQNAAQTHAKNISGQDFSQNRTIQDTELAATRDRQQADIQNQQLLQERQINRDKYLAGFDRETQTTLKTMDDQLQTKLTQMNLASNDREKAAAMVAAVTNSYAEIFRTIGQAEGIPAETRDRYLEHAIEMQNNNLALVEQMFGINLDWAMPSVQQP